MNAGLLFVNVTQSSVALTRGVKASERSKILSHVQSKRRKAETRTSEKPWSKYTSCMTIDEVATAGPVEKKKTTTTATASIAVRALRPLTPPPPPPRPLLDELYPTHHGLDPPHYNTVGTDASPYATLHLTFMRAARTAFLAEAFAPPSVAAGSCTMRHDGAVAERLRRCANDRALMYATLTCGSSIKTTMMGGGGSPWYFFSEALREVRLRLAEPGCRADTWLLLSISSLAMAEMWLGISALRTPGLDDAATATRYRGAGPSLAACRIHLDALLHVVGRAGGWGSFDPYALENAILVDKHLALQKMRPPLIPLTWDPGAMPREMREKLAVGDGSTTTTLPRLGASLLQEEAIAGELRDIILDIVDYARIAHCAWSGLSVATHVESWLFLRLQSLTYRLLLLMDATHLSPVDRCVQLAALTFLLSATRYCGGQRLAVGMVRHLRAGLVTARFWEGAIDRRLLFWVLCTGAMATGTAGSPEKEWLLGLVIWCSSGLLPRLTEGSVEEALRGYLFLPFEQKSHLSCLISNLGDSMAIQDERYCRSTRE